MVDLVLILCCLGLVILSAPRVLRPRPTAVCILRDVRLCFVFKAWEDSLPEASWVPKGICTHCSSAHRELRVSGTDMPELQLHSDAMATCGRLRPFICVLAKHPGVVVCYKDKCGYAGAVVHIP